MRLTIYTDDTLSVVDRVVEADSLKIPYRVSMYIVQSLDSIDLNSEDDLLKLITSNVEKMDKILKATFMLTDSELECIDTAELLSVIKELFTWGINKVNSIRGGDSKNLREAR